MSEIVINQNDYSARRERYAELTDQELVDKFNHGVGCRGWTSSRATHLGALFDTFEERGIDLTAISPEPGSYSLGSRICLNELGIVELLPIES